MALDCTRCISVGIIQMLLVRVCEEVDANGEIHEERNFRFERKR